MRRTRNPSEADFESVSATIGQKIKAHIQHLNAVADDYREQANAVRDAWVESRWDDLKAMSVLTARDLHTLEAEEAKLIDLRPYSRNPSHRPAKAGHRASHGPRRDASGRFIRSR